MQLTLDVVFIGNTTTGRRTNLHTFIHSSLQGNRANASGQKGLKVKSFAFRIFRFDLQSSECSATSVHIYSFKLLINSLSCNISSLRLCISNSVNLTYGYLEDMSRTQDAREQQS